MEDWKVALPEFATVFDALCSTGRFFHWPKI